MAWEVTGKNISMAEGDFGVALPARVIGATVSTSDSIKFTFKRRMNGTTVLTKNLTPSDNTVFLTFTEEESSLFVVGQYVYSVDWDQNGIFMCNIIPMGLFKVVDKA